MDSILNKIDQYQILNCFMPGLTFVWLSGFLDIILIPYDNMLELIAIAYLCGMISSRLGVLFFEKPLLKYGLLKYASKEAYIEASKKDYKIEILTEMSNIYRAYIGMFILVLSLTIFSSLEINCSFVLKYYKIIIMTLIFMLFIVSFYSQIKHIKDRINNSK